MKNLVVLLIAFSGATAQAAAARGEAYCPTEAHSRTLLNPEQIEALCQGSDSALPVACYLDGRSRTVLSTDQIIELCVRATDLTPVDCYLDSRISGNLSADEIVRACQNYPGN